MPYRPSFKPHFHCEIVPNEGVFLLSEQEHFLLRGEAYAWLAPFLTGQYTLEELIVQLQDQLSPSELLLLLDNLQTKGYLADASQQALSMEEAAFWSKLGVTPDQVQQRLQAVSVSVRAVGQLEVAPLQAMLESLGVRVTDQGDCWVVLAEDYLQEGLATVNQQALSQGRPWWLVKPVGVELWIGPLFLPGTTGCWKCLAHRLRGSRKVERYLHTYQPQSQFPSTSKGSLPTTRQMAYGLAATEIVKWIVCETPGPLAGQVITLDTLTLVQQRHLLVQRPQCSACGNPEEMAKRQQLPVQLQSCPKSFTSDGGHRSVSPDDTFKKLAHHISPVTGLISSLSCLSQWETPDETLVPSYFARYNFDFSQDLEGLGTLQSLSALRESLRHGAYGKGKRPNQAKASALCEALERYAGIFQGDEARVRAKWTELQPAAILPNACMLFSERQFQQRPVQTVEGFGFQWVPEPFADDQEIDWSPVWSLTHHDTRYVPTAYCYHGYSQRFNLHFTRADSNGCAAGNTLEEAILQGFLELVERDSMALWWYNRLSRPAVALESFEEPYLQTLLKYYHSTLRRELWVLDMTSDLGIPAFVAVSRRYDQAEENILLGCGTHFDARLAVLRAVTELNQSLPAAVYGMFQHCGGYQYEDRDQAAALWWKTATLAQHPYLKPAAALSPTTPTTYRQHHSNDIYTDVMTCVQLAAEKGLEMLVLDQTRPDLGVAVVRVIVPGLRHFWPRFGPGRLYDVPVQMGWLTTPLREEELNPQAVFF